MAKLAMQAVVKLQVLLEVNKFNESCLETFPCLQMIIYFQNIFHNLLWIYIQGGHDIWTNQVGHDI